MLDAKRELELQEYAIFTDIAGVSIGGQKWFEYLKQLYSPKRESDFQFPDRHIGLGVMGAESDDAKNALMNIFTAKKQLGGLNGRH